MKKVRMLLAIWVFCFGILLVNGEQVQAAEAASGSCWENITYVLDSSGTLTISGSGKMGEALDDGISPWYMDSRIKKVIIKEGVTSIGLLAFGGCSNLTSIDIPEGVTSIGDYAFRDCSSLTSINIPEGVTSIFVGVFYGCHSLASINIPEGVTSIGRYTFSSF